MLSAMGPSTLINWLTLACWFDTFTRAARTSKVGIVEVFGAVVRLGVRLVFCASADTASDIKQTKKRVRDTVIFIIFPACSKYAKHLIIQYMRERSLEVRRLGRVAYADALGMQQELEGDVIDRREQDYLLLLEHPHTFTLGRRSKNDGVLATAEMLRKLGVDVFEINRGGKITYHGVGQIVGYPIINLSPDREDVHKYVRDLEEVLIRTMLDFGIDAFRIEGLTGVHSSEGKIAAIGVHIKRWVTTHGFALNVNTDLSFYNWIIACEGEPVASMERILGRVIDLADVEDRIIEHFREVFGYEIRGIPVGVKTEMELCG